MEVATLTTTDSNTLLAGIRAAALTRHFYARLAQKVGVHLLQGP